MAATSSRRETRGPYRTRLTGQLALHLLDPPVYVYPEGYTAEVRMNKHDVGARREAAVFKSNRSQAVRIPKDLAFAEDVKRVTIERTADGALVIRPVAAENRWNDFFKNGPFVTDDFMQEREQGTEQERT